MTENSFKTVSSAISDRGLSEKRPQNEDSYLEMPEKGLFAVADGVGGAQAGDVASQMAVEILAEAFNNLREGHDVEEVMNTAITRANSAIYQMSHELPQLSTMATTIVALQITENIATIGHVGDSRLYRLDSRGNLFRETQDHSVVEEEVRAGRMTPEQAENHPSKNVISRALGAESSVEIDMKTIMFEPNTAFLLCSDGITRHISDFEIRELLQLPQAPVLLCQQMKEICYERGAEDNLTAVLIRVAGEGAVPDADVEESTVASARAAYAGEPQGFAPVNEAEIPTQNLQMPAHLQPFETPNFTEDPPAHSVGQTAPSILGDAVHIPARTNQANSLMIERDEKTYVIDETPASGGFLGRFLLFLLGLLLGGALGAGGYYYYATMQQPIEQSTVPPLTKMESPNISFTEFEKSRRNVDSDPQKFLKNFEKTAPNGAEDHYLIGRAYLLSGEYPSARDALIKAKEALPDYKGENKLLMQNEIAIAYALAKSEFSVKELEKDKGTANTANIGNTKTLGNSLANVNTGLDVNSNR
jgi:serine/threonine protein phosphatase PrpC